MEDVFSPRRKKIRDMRSLLLDFINAVYPCAMSETDLVETMYALPDQVCEEFTQRDLQYMKDRGLIEEVWWVHPVSKARVKQWKMTASGVTFMEREKPWAELEHQA
jgi:hypothetical protein